ncbi:uncharacterized protein B0I36DRAFT_5581 [Microdochium trichocladiopsis]|uniref:Uncharacterized protein n=1 Tax=Microdochium trichocladiopsis TaxID=1682393 RepID=A0A9P8YIS0_9PEZI|nr:uncharacterized protein B0I36DRAFT_5581 [Microdochium trichocladiopsis]KAH7040096.1 hypothetical protein B0I36DRAFT_5581 [Microdochium trichocladiopsis]
MGAPVCRPLLQRSSANLCLFSWVPIWALAAAARQQNKLHERELRQSVSGSSPQSLEAFPRWVAPLPVRLTLKLSPCLWIPGEGGDKRKPYIEGCVSPRMEDEAKLTLSDPGTYQIIHTIAHACSGFDLASKRQALPRHEKHWIRTYHIPTPPHITGLCHHHPLG